MSRNATQKMIVKFFVFLNISPFFNTISGYRAK